MRKRGRDEATRLLYYTSQQKDSPTCFTLLAVNLPTTVKSTFCLYPQFPNVNCVSNRILTRNFFFILLVMFQWFDTKSFKIWKNKQTNQKTRINWASWLYLCFFVTAPDISCWDLSESSFPHWHQPRPWHSTCARGREVLSGRDMIRSMRQLDCGRQTSWSGEKPQRRPTCRHDSGTTGVQV